MYANITLKTADVRCYKVLFIVELTRTQELYGVAAAGAICIHTILR